MDKPQGLILITGATGFIGKRLTQRLLDDGFTVRCMVHRTTTAMPSGAEIVQCNMLEPATLVKALEGIDTVYYLVHSMAGTVTKAIQPSSYFSRSDSSFLACISDWTKYNADTIVYTVKILTPTEITTPWIWTGER